MSLAPGSRLGRYEIVAPLGAGGMGEVYRATDTALQRDVALKILPAGLVADRTRLMRFEQEARATAALHHPNIVTIHDFGIDDGTPFLITELLEGESLADVVGRGALPLRRAVSWSLQVLRGIAAAHARGIIHRDLKPANIFILSDGSVKVLDFGLAKVTEDASTLSGGVTQRLSQPGTVLGTIGYMAPEQIRGAAVDARSDIFSFGVVLQEMLTGRAPFRRNSNVETLAAILRDDPPPLETPPFPAVLAATLLRCLEKKPEERFHSAHDLALHLETIDLGSSGPTPIAPAPPPVPAVEQVTFHRGNILSARFAPDGSIVYGALWNDRPLELYVSHRGTAESRALGIPGSIHSISKSGDMAVSLGRRAEVGFQFSGTLARVPLIGGVPRPIANEIYEADWLPDGKQLVIVRRAGRGFRIECPIGHAIYESPSWIGNMRVSPNGSEIAFIEHPFAGDNMGHVKVVGLNGDVQQLTDDLYIAWGLAWHPVTGEIWYSAATAGNEARPASVLAVSRSTPPRDVFSSLGPALLHDIAPDGTMLISQESVRRQIIAHIDGQERDRDLSWFDWSFPMKLSADGRTLLFEEQGVAGRGVYTFYIRGTDGSPAVRLEHGRARDLTADGESVLAIIHDARLVLVPTGAGETREIPVRGIDHYQTARFLPGDRAIAAIGFREGEAPRLWRIPIEGGDAVPLTAAGTIESWFFLAIAPRGDRIAVVGADNLPALCSLERESAPQPVPGAIRGDAPVRWQKENELLVCQRREHEAQIFAIDLTSGARTFLHTLRPPDVAGVEGLFPIHYASENDSYIFGYRLLLSSLFVVTGVR
jgi:serine/threonine protein kinase/Tol biopolymer transport system component